MSHRKRKLMSRRASQARLNRWAWLAIASATLVLAGLAIWLWPTATSDGQAGPRLVVNQERVDLGRVPFNKTVRVSFQLNNQGDQPLQLDASAPVRVVEGC
ncbi:MAG: hypothetical protein HY259_00545 [Chloroflexi bacterium]|nr:hypothetical protein [Chloroflexota bacterium]MBI3731939.1 hypothetical protein [Chloroflexota bacterium]